MFFKVLQKNTFSHKTKSKSMQGSQNYPRHWSIDADEGVPTYITLKGKESATKHILGILYISVIDE